MSISKTVLEKVSSNITPMTKLINQGIGAHATESDTRSIVEKILEILGWDMFEYSTDQRKNENIDYVVKTKEKGSEKKFFAVEVKSIETELKEQLVKKAKEYAIDEGIDYVVLTNGDRWIIYHVELDDSNIPRSTFVLETTISSPDIKKKDKAAALSLLAKPCFNKKISELDAYYEYHNALSGDNILDALLSSRCINAIRLQLRQNTGQNLSNEEVGTSLINEVIKEDCVTETIRKKISRL